MIDPEIIQKLTSNARKSIKEAEEIAAFYSSRTVNPVHLLYAIFLQRGSLGNNILKNINLKEDLIIKNMLSEDGATIRYDKKNDAHAKNNNPQLSRNLRDIIIRSFRLASTFHYPYVGTEHLIYSLLESDDSGVKSITQELKPKKNIINFPFSSMSENDPFSNFSKLFNFPEITLTKKKTGKSSATPYLDQFCLDLMKDARERQEIVIGREMEIERIANILGRKNKNNPVLIGEPGVGKTAIVMGLAQKINSGDVVPVLQNKRLLQLDMALVVAGTSYRGEFEARLKEIIREAAINKDIVLFIDEIHSIVGAGNANGGLDAANILKPALSRGDIQCIGATTLEEYKKYIEKDPALERRLQPIKVNEPDIKEAIKIVEGIKEGYEKFHNLKISSESIRLAVELSVKYMPDRFLPDKAIDIMDETASYVRNKNKITDFMREIKKLSKELDYLQDNKNNLVNSEKYEDAIKLRESEKEIRDQIEKLRKKQREAEQKKKVIISTNDLFKTVSQISGIPLSKLAGKKDEKIKNLEKNLNAQIIGQKEAIKQLTNTIYRNQSGISSFDRPLGSFMLLGPTGVGKTLTAKVLARTFYENPKALIRIDMSEFMERHNVSKLIGAPAGYVGYGEGGKLTETVRRQPYSVVLFDEIEKAHPDVFNILLQVLEEGVLTDAEGKTINFKETIIILTSNMGTEDFTNSARIGFETGKKNTGLKSEFESVKSQVLEKLRKNMRPEIINRIDYIAVFNPLREKEIEKITAMEIRKLERRLKEKKIIFHCSPPVIKFLAKKNIAFDQGARLVRKNIQELVENEIAKMIVNGKVQNNKISLDIKKGKIKLF
ncbi:MAG: hypothetical protein A3J63_03410 [Candidatus Moranbacteria bacterium RIFCSPHIGHO2_02_FULL_40_12b]|nr:MAG: hypothetical protein A3J63_03410 [Candidatus Moranbacteria bacterium RIFCSPHIGHO2_02_FULL_40_12b]OGI23681.1 MAG: hypothetical protein A3E91_04060 [Candidatus Moranbacteria bacterium RIFCSPHIGHO2_12_FULL_40_10]